MAQLKATYKEIFQIATPLIVGNLAWTMNGLFDTIFVGNLGKVELDAIGFASIFYSVLFMMGFSFTRGTQLLIARRMGELNRKEVGNIFDNTIVALMAVAVTLFVVVKIFLHQILSFMLTNPEVISKCEEFLHYRMWGLIPSFLTFIFIAFYSGIGKTMILMVSIALMTVLNISLNYGLVYGKLGLPHIGIGGSGAATSISETIAVLVLLGGTFIKSRIHDFALFKFRKIDLPLLKQMGNISVPLMLQTLIAVGGWLFLFARIETVLGTADLAVSTIFRQLILFLTIPTWSLGSTANTVISNLVGQKDFEGVKLALQRISLVSLGFAVFSCLLVFLFPRFFVGMFIKFIDEKDYNILMERALAALPVLNVTFLIMSFSNIVFNGVISVGSIYTALLIEVVVIVIYVAYFSVLFTFPFVNIFWIWTAEWIYWISMFAGSMIFFRYKHLKVV